MRRVAIGATPPRRCRGDSGQVGGIEVLPFGFLFFVAGTLLIANAWAFVDARMAVASAAREAARAYVEAPDEPTATVDALTRARETLAAYGRDGAAAIVHPPEVIGGFARCARVRITVEYDVPALVIPFLGGFGDLPPVSASHTELVDPFRSGLTGEARC
jgi:hypothetical protein